MRKCLIGLLCILGLSACGQSLSSEHKNLYTTMYKSCIHQNLNEAYCTKAADLVIHYFNTVDEIKTYQEPITHIIHRDYVPRELLNEMKDIYTRMMDSCMLSNHDYSLSFCRCRTGMTLYPFDDIHYGDDESKLNQINQQAIMLCPLFESLDKPNLFGF